MSEIGANLAAPDRPWYICAGFRFHCAYTAAGKPLLMEVKGQGA